jgi:dipeptidyl aminopeptidase/acylaminoacyl peptidase
MSNQSAALQATQSPVFSRQSPTSVPPTATLLPPTPTQDPYTSLTIDALTVRSYGGGELDIIDTLEENETFTRYLITYPSDGLTIYGFMNVPNEGNHFPVALVLHGYIDPAEYDTLAYTQRYADALAGAGYFVIHPNFRNYPPSDEGPNPYRIGYAIDVLNLIAIIREQSQDPFGYLRRADEDRIHLWGHSMGGGVTLRVITVNNEPYLGAAVLYGSMSGDERKNFEQIRIWSGGENGPFELAADNERLAAISPINFLDRINTPISIHHSEADGTVPIAWSNDLCERLRTLNKRVECYTYYATPHTFRGQADELFIERVTRFFNEN